MGEVWRPDSSRPEQLFGPFSAGAEGGEMSASSKAFAEVKADAAGREESGVPNFLG